MIKAPTVAANSQLVDLESLKEIHNAHTPVVTMYEAVVKALWTSACRSTPALWTKILIHTAAKIADPSGGVARTREMTPRLYVCLNSSAVSSGSPWILFAIFWDPFPNSGLRNRLTSLPLYRPSCNVSVRRPKIYVSLIYRRY